MQNMHPLFSLLLWMRNELSPEQLKVYLVHGPEIYYAWWTKLLQENPHHVVIETVLMIFIIWLIFIRKTIDPKESKSKLTQKEIDWLVDTWKPEPLVPEDTPEVEFPIIESVNGHNVRVRGVRESVLNLASNDFLGLGQLPSFKEKARQALDKYGCGACGPRGFYGTIDVHLEFEKNLAAFMGTEQAICYSDGASAVSSTIPAYSKKGDLLLVDEGCCEPIRTGVNLSRSSVTYFKHNNMKDLEMLLEAVVKDDKLSKRDVLKQRRFIIVEGLYRHSGDLCPLPELVAFKNKYKFRLIVDESLSFGTIGKTGRGVTEHFGVGVENIDMLTVAMDNTLGSIGGGCVGTREVVDHQRLSGSGYCFSASAPPFLFASAIDSLEKLQSNGRDYLTAMRSNVKALLAGLQSIPQLTLISSEESPVVHLALTKSTGSYDSDLVVIKQIATACMQQGVGLVATTYDAKLLADMKHDNKSLRATLRINVNAQLSAADVKKIVKELKAATAQNCAK